MKSKQAITVFLSICLTVSFFAFYAPNIPLVSAYTGTIIYSASTNTITAIGGTSGTPIGFNDLYLADKAGTYTLKTRTGVSAIDASPISDTNALRPTDKVVLGGSANNLYVATSSFTGLTSYVITIVGTDNGGNSQSEILTVMGNGNTYTAKAYTTVASTQITALVGVGSFSYSLVQAQWGVSWETNAIQYSFSSVLVIGDGSTSTFFEATNIQVTFLYVAQNTIIDVKALATLTFGTILDQNYKTTSQGVDMFVLRGDGANPNGIYAESGSTVNLYSSNFKVMRYDTLTLGANQLILYGNITRIWNCYISYGEFYTQGTSAKTDFYNVVNTNGRSDGLFRMTGEALTINKLYDYSGVNILRSDMGGNPTIYNVFARNITNVISNSNYPIGNVTFVNPDIDVWAFAWSAPNGNNGYCYRSYTFDLTVVNSTAMLQNANVTLSKDGAVFYSGLTNSSGQVATQALVYGYYRQPSGNILQDATSWNLTITAINQQTYTTTFYPTAPITWNIALGALVTPTTYADAAFTWTPGNPSTNQTVTFTANSSYNNTVVNWYYWNYGDGSIFNGTSNIATHQFGNMQSYNVTLTINTSLGNSTITQVVTVGTGDDYTALIIVGAIFAATIVAVLVMVLARKRNE